MGEPSAIQPVDPGPVVGAGSERVSTVSDRDDAPLLDRSKSPVALILAAGVLAGLVAWLGGEACRDLIKARRRAVNAKGITLSVVTPRDQDVADARNAGLAFAWLGAALGACLGGAGGLAGGSGRRAMSAAGFGSMAGVVGCAAMSLALLPLYDAYRHRNPDEASRDLIFPLLVHAGVWSVAGAVGGAAFAMGAGRRRLLPLTVVGGLVGAAVAAGLYELIGVVAFPDAGTTRYVSLTWPSRLLARLAVGSLAASGIAFAVVNPHERPARPAA